MIEKCKNYIRLFYKARFEIIRKSHLAWYNLVMAWLATHKDQVNFMCNICGSNNCDSLVNVFDREKASCQNCGSNLRTRSLIDILSRHFMGESLILAKFKEDKSISAIGMSDWPGYAEILKEKFSYTNTYYHKEPYLDITEIKLADENKYDFIISSDVLEHIRPPVIDGFVNLKRLLKPGGILILTVPFMHFECTWEHFPNLYEYVLQDNNGQHVLKNKTLKGKHEVFRNLNFHGGPGSTLEMRIFTKNSLHNNLLEAGFSQIRFHNNENLKYGIKWPIKWSYPISAINS